jgi:hypothetical protein
MCASGGDIVAEDVRGWVDSQGFVPLDITMLHAQLEDVALASDDRVFDQFRVSRFW